MDCETTGLNAYKNDVIQLALIIEEDGRELGSKVFFMQPHSWENIEQGALDVHKMTMEQIKTFPKPKETHGEIKKFLGQYVNRYDKMDKLYPAGFNVAFDIAFIQHFFKKCGDGFFGSFFNYKAIDPMQLIHILDAKNHIKSKNHKLATLCEYFKIPLKAHDAESDIRATKELMEFLGFCMEIDAQKLEAGYVEFCQRRGESNL